MTGDRPSSSSVSRAPTGARVVVTQTKNGGKSLKVLKKGLPQSDAYDLVYRHALDVDALELLRDLIRAAGRNARAVAGGKVVE